MKRNLRYVLAVLGLAIISLMIMDFNNRMSELSRLSRQRDQVAVQVTQLNSTQTLLQTQMAYVTSESSVVEQAYEEERMVDPRDVLIVPIAPGESTPAVTPTPAATPVVYQNWQYWYVLFFDPQP
jgi:hypothetical protein